MIVHAAADAFHIDLKSALAADKDSVLMQIQTNGRAAYTT